MGKKSSIYFYYVSILIQICGIWGYYNMFFKLNKTIILFITWLQINAVQIQILASVRVNVLIYLFFPFPRVCRVVRELCYKELLHFPGRHLIIDRRRLPRPYLRITPLRCVSDHLHPSFFVSTPLLQLHFSNSSCLMVTFFVVFFNLFFLMRSSISLWIPLLLVFFQRPCCFQFNFTPVIFPPLSSL
jgi:hypothetical protein